MHSAGSDQICNFYMQSLHAISKMHFHESDEKKANSALLLPSAFPRTPSPAPATGGPRLHRSVTNRVNLKFASRNFAKTERYEEGRVYCAARDNATAFVFATFCTIMRTPHLVGGPTGF